MKRLVKKLSIIACATMLVGAGISGVALAANSNAPKAQKAEHDMPLMPPIMEKMAEKLDLTDAQKTQLEALKEKQQALRAEFWAVFTDEQKTTMLEVMMKHRKDRDGEHSFRKGHEKERRSERRDQDQRSDDQGKR